jgi:protein-tyrosine phosphatase
VHGILFVCHGNICRSPYAAAVFAQRLPAALRSHIKVASAGFIGPGRPVPSEARTVAARHGVDLSSHRSQLVTAPGLDTYELVVVMAPDQVKGLATAYPATTRIIVLGDLDPEPISKRAIIDPFGHPEEIFDESYARIDRCLDALILQMFAFTK